MTRGCVNSSVVAFEDIALLLNKLNILDDASTKVTVILAPDPASSDTKIDLTTAVLNVGTTTSNLAGFTLYRDSTILQQGDAATNLLRTTTMMYIPYGNNKTVNLTMQHLDSPSSTSELTYKVKYLTYNTNDFWVNRSDRDYAGIYYDYRPTSVLTVMEVGA